VGVKVVKSKLTKH